MLRNIKNIVKKTPFLLAVITKIRNIFSRSRNINTEEYWNRELSKTDNFWRNDTYCNILDLFPKDEEFSLLDIGCALGDGCELLQEQFPKAKITGIDISSVGIEKARRRGKKVPYFIADIRKDPIHGCYDYITMIETLEHFDDPFLIVDKCLRHVKKAIIISTPYTERYTGFIRRSKPHRYYFNKDTFKKYNCEIMKITPPYTADGAISIIYKIYPYSV